MENTSFSPLEQTQDVTKEALQKLRVDLPTFSPLELEKLEKHIDTYAEAKKDYLEKNAEIRTELFALRHEVMEQREETPVLKEVPAVNTEDIKAIEKILSYEEFAGLKKPSFSKLDRLMHVLGITSLAYLVYRLRTWFKQRSNKPLPSPKPAVKAEPKPLLRDIGSMLAMPVMKAKVKEKTAVKKTSAKAATEKSPKKEVKKVSKKTPEKPAPKPKKEAKKKEPVEEMVFDPAPEPEVEPVKKSTPMEGPMVAGETEVTFDTKEIDGERETIFALGSKTYRVSALTLLGEIDAGKMVSSVEREEGELCITGTLSGLTKTVYITSDEIALIGTKLEGGAKSFAAVTITYFDAPLSKKNRTKHTATLKFTSI